MKRIILAVLPVLLMSGCSTENQQNQQVTAAQPLTQPTTAEQATQPTQTTQAQADGQATTVTQTNADATAEQTQVVSNAYLTASEIQAQFIGVNLKWKDKSSNLTGRIIYNHDSRANYKFGSWSGHGKWKMEGDKFCDYFPPQKGWQGATWKCSHIFVKDGKYIKGVSTFWKA